MFLEYFVKNDEVFLYFCILIMRRNAYITLHLSILLAGGTGLFGRLISVGEVPLVWIRVIMAAIFLIIVMVVNGRLPKIPRSDALRIMACGVILAIHWCFYYGSIKYANVSIGAVCFALVGFFTAILEPLLSRHKPSLREILLSLLTVAGISLIFGFDARYRLGICIGVLSSLFYTFFSLSSKRTQALTGHKSSTMLLYELIGGGIFLTLATPVYAQLFPDIMIMPSSIDWVYLLLFSTVFTIMPFLLLFKALRSISAFTVNLSYNLEPVYTILAAMILFSEAKELNVSFWIGITLIILSVLLQTFGSKMRF